MTADSGSLYAKLLIRCHFAAAPASVTCAVSGGADSLAMLVLARAAGLDVTAIHVDHGLRSGSAMEADVVRDAAARQGAAFEQRVVDLAEGPNLEARARAARHAALPREALFGHTADDQAETVLLHLMRGTGPEGLAAMSPDRHPILGLRRHETEAVCMAAGLTPVTDPSNAEARFRRNRVRNEVLPLLGEVADRDVVPLLARTADLQREIVVLLDDLAEGIDPTDAVVLRSLPVGVARHVLRSWWRRETTEDYAPPASAIERMLSVAKGTAASEEVVHGWRFARTGGRLRLVAPPLVSRPVPADRDAR